MIINDDAVDGDGEDEDEEANEGYDDDCEEEEEEEEEDEEEEEEEEAEEDDDDGDDDSDGGGGDDVDGDDDDEDEDEDEELHTVLTRSVTAVRHCELARSEECMKGHILKSLWPRGLQNPTSKSVRYDGPACIEFNAMQ